MRLILLFFLLFIMDIGCCQEKKMKSINQLIKNEDLGWKTLSKWYTDASNNIEFLDVDKSISKEVLYNIQVTTNSLLGAVIYRTGGILVDNGWVRILGGGNKRLKRSPRWLLASASILLVTV